MKKFIFFIIKRLHYLFYKAQSILDLELKAVDLYHSEMYLEAEEEFRILKSKSKYESYKLEIDYLEHFVFITYLTKGTLKSQS